MTEVIQWPEWCLKTSLTRLSEALRISDQDDDQDNDDTLKELWAIILKIPQKTYCYILLILDILLPSYLIILCILCIIPCIINRSIVPCICNPIDCKCCLTTGQLTINNHIPVFLIVFGICIYSSEIILIWRGNVEGTGNAELFIVQITS
jgi:hypothetical protein